MMTAVGVTLPADPRSLLEYLDPVLGQTGCIKNTQEVQKFVSLMKEAQVLVSRCIILNVIKATKTQSTLERFMEAGGWAILNLWLAEAKKNLNLPLIVEILQVLQKLPVTIAALKQGNMGKLIKQLSKQEHPDVKHFAAELLSKWMAVFKEGQAAKARSDRPSNSSIEDAGVKPATAKPDKPDKPEKKERSGRKESKKDKNKAAVSPVEASQPPPGPLVPLGRPKERTLKRPRDLLLQKGQLPPEKKVKPSPYSGTDEKSAKGKGPVESEGFMNALSSQAARMKEKKIKKINKTPAKPTSSTAASKLTSTSEGGEGTPSEGVGEEQHQEETIADSEGPGVAYSKKKRVSWAEEDNLVMVHYFEMDESERANVSGHKSFLDAAQQEKMKEREALASGLMFSRDRLIEMIPWQRPVKLEGALALVERGADSEQRKVQAEREEKVLAQLFLSKSSLPPTASEPDPEPDIIETETKFIPLMEPNAPDMHPHPVFASPTRVAPPGQLLPPDSPLPSPATTIHQAQSLINYYNETNNTGMPPRGPPMMDMPYQGGREGGGNLPPGDYFNYQQGYPPDNSWGGPPGPGYFGDQFYHGRGGGPHRGRGSGFRGRGGGRFFGKRAPYPDSRICKHFITHGCKLGSQCRFLHCTPEELASQMAHEQQKGQGPPPRPNGGPPPHHLEPLQQQSHPVMEHMDAPHAAPAPSEQQT